MDNLKPSGNLKAMERLFEQDGTTTNNTQNKQIRLVVLTKVNICVCCGARSVGLIKLQNCSHKEFLECYFKNRINCNMRMVCHYCHGFLKKIDDFKKQVEQCLTDRLVMLYPKPKYTALAKPIFVNIKPENIQEKGNSITQATLVEVPPCKEPEMRVKQESVQTVKEECDDTDMSQAMDVCETEIEEIPVVDNTAGNPDIQTKVACLKGDINLKPSLRNIQQPTNIVKSPEPVKSTKVLPKAERLDGKVQIITISREELEIERERERLNEMYTSMVFKCEDCIMGFTTQKIFASHMKEHQSKTRGDYICDVCKLAYTSESLLRNHQQYHWKRYQCVPCGKTFKTSLSFCISHYNTEHAIDGQIVNRTYECSKHNCNFICSNFPEYRKHRRSHISRRCCDECGNSYTNNRCLKVHIETVHKNIQRIIHECKDCGKQYKTIQGLVVHRDSEHAPKDEGPLPYCSICKRQFKTQWTLYAHNRRHAKPIGKKFICDMCGQRFSSKVRIRDHIDSVHLKTEYKCEHCGKVCYTKESLRKHIKEKHQPVPREKILCDVCGKEYLSKKILQTHMITHTGERPHKCCFCSATFGFAAALHTHKRLVHKQPKKNK